jgi:putative oxidoreductase
VIGILVTGGAIFGSFYKVTNPTILAPWFALVLFGVGLAATGLWPGRKAASFHLADLSAGAAAVSVAVGGDEAAEHGDAGAVRPADPGPGSAVAVSQVADVLPIRQQIARLDSDGRILDFVLLVFRLILGWVFIYHGSQKLFGAFGGYGLHGTGGYMASLGLHPGLLWAVVGGLIEFVGGIGMLAGLGARIWGILMFGDMLIAILAVNWANGLISEKAAGGFEINLALGALGLCIFLLGAGGWSLDRVLGFERAIGIDRWTQRTHRSQPGGGEPAAKVDAGVQEGPS